MPHREALVSERALDVGRSVAVLYKKKIKASIVKRKLLAYS
jgi:hypothetical protein